MKDLKNIDKVVFEALNDFKEEPSGFILSNIKGKLYYRNLFRRILSSLFSKIFISIAAISILTFAILFITDKEYYSHKTPTKSNTTELRKSTNINNAQNYQSSDIIKKSIPLDNKQKSLDKDLNSIFENTTDDSKTISNKSDNRNQEINPNISNNTVSNKQIEPVKDLSFYKSLKDTIKPDLISTKDTIKVIETIKYVDTIRVYDTVRFYDTITTKITENVIDIDKDKYKFSVDLYFAPALSKSIYNNSQSQELANLMDNSTKPLPANTFGVGLNYHHKNLSLQTGVAYTLNKESFSISTEKTDVSTRTIVDIVEFNFYSIDTNTTIEYIFDDSLGIIIDTNITITLDSTMITQHDTIVNNVTDTIKTKDNYNEINSYSYVEIPLIVGYSFNLNKLELNTNFGVITGILTGVKGKTINPVSINEVTNIDQSKFTKVSFSIYGSLGVNYLISDNIGLFGSVYYRRNLKSLYTKDYPVNKISQSYGLKAGIRYYL